MLKITSDALMDDAVEFLNDLPHNTPTDAALRSELQRFRDDYAEACAELDFESAVAAIDKALSDWNVLNVAHAIAEIGNIA